MACIAECHASYWLFTVGFTVLYGSLIIKNYRILKIFSEWRGIDPTVQ